MPASVRDALKEVFKQEGGLSSDDANQMLAVMETSGRLQCETWSWSWTAYQCQWLQMKECTYRTVCHVVMGNKYVITWHTVIINSIIVIQISRYQRNSVQQVGSNFTCKYDFYFYAASWLKTTSRWKWNQSRQISHIRFSLHQASHVRRSISRDVRWVIEVTLRLKVKNCEFSPSVINISFVKIMLT